MQREIRFVTPEGEEVVEEEWELWRCGGYADKICRESCCSSASGVVDSDLASQRNGLCSEQPEA